MVITRFGGCKTALAFAVSSAIAGCSAMDQASGPNVTNAQTAAATPVAAATDANTPQVAGMAGETAPVLEKSGRIHIASLPASLSVTEIQTAALASPDPAPQPVPLAIAPVADATNAAQAIASASPAAGSAPATSTLLAAAAPAQQALSTKSGRIVQPQLSGGPVANETTVTTAELPITTEMVAVQSVVPTPKPTAPNMMLAYAGPNDAVSGMMNAGFFPPAPGAPIPETADASNPELNKLITRYAGLYGVPESLVHRVVHRESKYDPKAYHKNGYWGLMQITYPTAKSMGYQGPAKGLLDAETNLRYAIKYLRGAWLVAGNNSDNAIKLYARGYYYDAKRKNMLHVLQ
ncbi:lytic transglycosylase domain-containing protein [Endobacterium cereale]|jgi:soluble lytic murein transglycosylase-like protein|nr:lytic transglycosylase domain-containing protein [Endobacterium cereale]MEB2843213.1 lytic transglycosylase domain-containing protein [Endobacterium cereale]